MLKVMMAGSSQPNLVAKLQSKQQQSLTGYSSITSNSTVGQGKKRQTIA